MKNQEICSSCNSDDTETYINNEGEETGYYCYACGDHWFPEDLKEEKETKTMKTVEFNILFDNGSSKKYVTEVKKEATEKKLNETIKELTDFFAESFKEDKHGNFGLTTQYGVNVIINLKKITAVELKIVESEEYIF